MKPVVDLDFSTDEVRLEPELPQEIFEAQPEGGKMDTTFSLLERQRIVGEPERRYDNGFAKGRGKHLDRIPASRLATRLELLRNTLRPTPHVQLAMKGMDLFAKLEYVNPVGSIKDRAAYWILRRAAERGEICEETTVIESSS